MTVIVYVPDLITLHNLCSKRRCGATGQCVCDTASVITGTDDKGVKKVIQIQPGERL